MTDERVFVVPRASVPDEASWYGLRQDGLDAFVAGLERDGRYEPRALMERDPSFKQVIPYLVLRDGWRFFLMQRTAAGGDARLHGHYSIGVGGHLNPGDGGVLGGLRREWAEELVADFVPAFRFVALLNDDTTEVGAVHLGAVYVADAAGGRVSIRETDKLTGRFAEPAEVAAVLDRMETWSRLTFEFLALQPTGYETRVTDHPRAPFASATGARPIIGAPGEPDVLDPAIPVED
jgi:predicted NUDIX family phosphoesterase